MLSPEASPLATQGGQLPGRMATIPGLNWRK